MIDTFNDTLKSTEIKEKEFVPNFQYLCEENPLCMFIINTNAETVYLNQTWTRITGYSVEESLGKRWLNYIHPEDREIIASKYFNHVQNKRDEYLEYRIVCADQKTIKWVFASSRYMDEKHGHIGFIEDITKRKNILHEIEKIKRL
jgi:PAS domain S-box-containing protein